MKRSSLKSSAMLLGAAFIWGTAFVAQSVGLGFIGPMTFNAVRMPLGALAILPLIWLSAQRQIARNGRAWFFSRENALWRGGLSCGVVLFFASCFQQLGIQRTTAGKAGFITALYIVFVPILGLLLHRKPAPTLWLAVGIAAAGLWLLSVREDLSIGQGDLLVLVGSVFFALHILVIDHFSSSTEGVMLSGMQFMVCGVLSLPPALLFESPELSGIWACRWPVLYTAVFSCGIAYTLQILGQKGAEPTVACLVMSMESVFAALAGWLFLQERLTLRELIGCVLVFAALCLAQLAPQKRKSPAVPAS